MTELVFFRQARADGGARTGLFVDGAGSSLLEGGGEFDDPSLLWYVDVRLSGSDIPADVKKARDWLLRHSELLAKAYSALSDRLEIGLDADIWPLMVKVEGGPPGVDATAVCSCTRRISGISMGETVSEIAAHWQEHLQRVFQEQESLT